LSRIPRRWAAAVAAATIAVAVPVGLQVVGQGTASASTVPNATVVSSPSVFKPDPQQSATVTCPTGKVVIGGGARVNGASHVVITKQQPFHNGSGDGMVVTAQEDQVGIGGNWAVQAFAICTDPLNGYAIVSKAGTAGSGAFQGVTATCPAGKVALGTGGRIDNGNGQVNLSTIAEGGLGSNRSTATGTEDLDGFNGNWNVTAFSICATPNSVTDFQVVQNQASFNGAGRKFVTVDCPQGKRVTGAGAFTNTPAAVEVVVPDAFRLRVQAGGRSDVSAGSWSVTAYAFCAS
jgi:hypothetical protein